MSITFKLSLTKIKCKQLDSKDTDYKLLFCEYHLSRKVPLTKNKTKNAEHVNEVIY